MPTTSLVVHSDPDILGGTPVFVGTRVPFRNLIDYLERNHSLDEFLDSFPTVSRRLRASGLDRSFASRNDSCLDSHIATSLDLALVLGVRLNRAAC